MLHVHHSNCMERLRDRLLEVTAPALTRALSPETIVVQHLGMGRWLALELARCRGIAANLAFPFPASFIWDLFTRTLPGVAETSPFARAALLWRIMDLLPQLAGQTGFEAPRHYLDQGDTLKRYQLACRIADVFDQYLVYRPDWIEAWEAGESSHWQAQLWRTLAATIKGEHRVRLLRRFMERCDEGAIDVAALPERVSVFGISALPPAYLEVLARLAELTSVHLFALNPCVAYWGDVVDERALARLRARWRREGRSDASSYYSVGHPLLASTGRLGREFLDALHVYPRQDEELFEPPPGNGVLAMLQADMLLLQDRAEGVDDAEPPLWLDSGDDSIQVHVCHSPMREVQVLHDRLLALFEADATLRPQDVVVMMPRVDDYAPYIQAVFDTVPRERFIPWSIADRAAAAAHPIVQVFLQLLRLPSSRFQASEVLALLEVPAVLRRFRLDAAAFERIREWVSESGIRWGRDATARAEAGLPALEYNTWRFGLERLLLGYAMPPRPPGRERLFRGRLPYADIEGSEAVWLGQLQTFLATLDRARRTLAEPQPPADWVSVINGLLDLFEAGDEAEAQALQTIRDAVDAVRDSARAAAFDRPLELDVVREAVLSRLGEPAGGHRFLSGQVTFCAMMPMRSVPFRVVCLIGMNDADFPRRDTPLGFDLMARERRAGDRARRDEDRTIFLEALLSARDKLHVSYVGRSARDNSPRLPSVLVSELLDTLDRGFRHADGAPSAALVTEHPLQPFSTAYFSPDEPRLFSYAAEWQAGARALQDAGREPVFAPAPLTAPDEALRQVSLTALVRFFKNPARAFLQDRLGVYLQSHDDEIDDDEAFAFDALADYTHRQRVLERLLAGASAEECYRVLRAEGRLPVGAFGRQVFEGYRTEAEAMIAALQPWLTDSVSEVDVELDLDGFRLSGRLEGVGESGLLRYRLSGLKAPDQLSLWIEHLALNATAGQRPSRHVAQDKRFELAPVTADTARVHLTTLLRAYWQGLREPLPFFPATSLAYAAKRAKGQPAAEALDSALKAKWNDNPNVSGEGSDAHVRTAFRGRDPFSADFDGWARAVCVPLIACVEGER